MRDLFRDSNNKSQGEGKFSFIEKVAQNALWRENFGKKTHVYTLVTLIYCWNIQRTWNGHQKVDIDSFTP